MSRFGSNGPAGYQVEYSAFLLQTLKQLSDSLTSGEARTQFAAALRAIHARLRKDPLVFGEHRYRLIQAQLAVRGGAIRPLHVAYGVHEERRLVS